MRSLRYCFSGDKARGVFLRRLFTVLLALLVLSLSGFEALAVTDESGHEVRMPGPAEEFSITERITIRNHGSMERSPYLDAAFSLLEEGNPFVARYNLLTGADVKPRFPYGVPYFIGGSKYDALAHHIPEYTVYASWQNSLYYRNGVNYLYGFDCSGFTRWVYTECGRAPHGSISDFLLRSEESALFCSGSRPMPDWKDLPSVLKPGALLAMTHPGYHIAMYVGTLRQFGYTEKQAPELKKYLDYPLVIHSSVNASIAARFQDLLRNGSPRYHGVTVTDGGVCVSIIGMLPKEAPHSTFQQIQTTNWFYLPDGTWLTVLDCGSITQYAWYE